MVLIYYKISIIHFPFQMPIDECGLIFDLLFATFLSKYQISLKKFSNFIHLHSSPISNFCFV